MPPGIQGVRVDGMCTRGSLDRIDAENSSKSGGNKKKLRTVQHRNGRHGRGQGCVAPPAHGGPPNTVSVRLAWGALPYRPGSLERHRRRQGNGFCHKGRGRRSGHHQWSGDPGECEHFAQRGRAKRPPGILLIAGRGIGLVSRPGLPVVPGEPAINPTPRQMIAENIGLELQLLENPDFEPFLLNRPSR